MKRKIFNIAIMSAFAGVLLASCGKDEKTTTVSPSTTVPADTTPTDNNQSNTDNSNSGNNNNNNTTDNTGNKDTEETVSEFTSKTMEIYKLATDAGFSGTYEEWLQSIKGDDIELSVSGTTLLWKYKEATEWKSLFDLSTIKGDKGESAYEVYKRINSNYTGSEEEWINALVLGTLISTTGEVRVEEDEATTGLEFVLSNDQTYYSVCGIGTEITATEIVIPETYNNLPVKEVAAYAFNYRNDLTKIVLPTSVTKINAGAFYGCSALTTIKMGKVSIAKDAFYNCNKLNNVYFRGTAADWFSNSFAELTSNPMYYASNLYINTADGSIYNANSALVFDIPSTVTEIKNYAFAGMTEVIGIVVPTSVTNIGKQAFYNTSKLETITLPFVGTSDKTNSSFGVIFGDETFTGAMACTQTFIDEWTSDTDYTTDTNTYYIPATLKNVTIKGTATIDDYAFAGVTMIESVYVAAPIAGIHVFDGCSALKKVKLVNAFTTIIPTATFMNCASLEAIEIPNTITVIGEDAFKNCLKLENVVLPNSIKYIYKTAFYSAGLKNVVSPYELKAYATLDGSEITSQSITDISDTEDVADKLKVSSYYYKLQD